METRLKRARIIYRASLILMLMLTIVGGVCYYLFYLEQRIPDRITLFEHQDENLDFGIPLEGEIVDAVQISNGSKSDSGKIHFSLDQPVTVKADSTGSYQAQLKLFGVLPYKSVEFQVVAGQKVMPSGRAVGLYIDAEGIMVLGTSEVEGRDGRSYEPSKNILQSGDYLFKINGKDVSDIEQVSEVLQKTEGRKVTLNLRRGKNQIDVKLSPVLANDGNYKIGVWLREDTEGIGTITYVDSKNGYAALGHGITDMDTGLLISIENGGVFPTEIQEIVSGKSGAPGEILGTVSLDEKDRIGTIQENTPYGIAGRISGEEYQYQENKAMEVGLKQNVKEGPAKILCQLGERVEEYDIEIETIRLNSKDHKGMVLRVTDERLLNKAGGIVQGMSGSPIIQKGKLIGAVTHVFVNDSQKGYGIFIEEMLGQ